MSEDTGIILNLKTFKVTEYQGDGCFNPKKFKTLKEAIDYIQTLEKTEYGITFINQLQ